MKDRIKLFEPIYDYQEKQIIQQVLTSGFWASGAGIGNVGIFEKKFQKYINSKSCIALNSGTAALHLALSVPDIKGKEVIIPSLSFVSTAHSVIYNGGKPVFADIEQDTLCIDPSSVDDKISDKTEVVLPVHFAGMPANLSRLLSIAKKRNCMLIEDAAHACGSVFNGKKIGAHGDLVCFSFHPVKNLAMPTGGLISINHKKHKEIEKTLQSRRWCGITDRREADYDVKEVGWNYYMNEFSAGIGLVQLKKLDRLNTIRKHIAKRYSSEINLEEKMPYNDDSSYHFYWVLVKDRTSFRKKMDGVGIETGIHYRPIHKMSMYKNKIKLPVTERIGEQIVSLPTHPNLSHKDVDRIISAVNAFSK